MHNEKQQRIDMDMEKNYTIGNEIYAERGMI